MTRFTGKGIIDFFMGGVIAAALMSSASAQGQERQFSAAAGAAVNDVLELAQGDQHQAAVDRLENLIQSSALNPYERSTIYQMLGQYNYELGRTREAQGDFEDAIKAGGLLPGEADNIGIVIAQLMIGNGQYREGADRLEAYLNAGGAPKPQYVDLLVNACVQDEDYARALPWAEKWFEAANPKARKHYDLLNFLYTNQGMEDRQAEIVKEMAARWPEDK